MADGKAPAVLSVRNFILGIINGTMFMLVMAFLDPDTVIPGFAWVLKGGDARWVGLLVGAIGAGWFWPQLFLAPYMAGRRRLMPWFYASATARIISLASLAVVAWHLDSFSPTVAITLVAGLLLLFTSSGGIGMIPFMTIVGETVPADWRGKFMGLRYLFGGLLGFGAGFVVKWLLSETSGLAFPQNYAWVFTMAAIFIIPAVVSFCFAREPERNVHPHRLPLPAEIRRGARLLRRDDNFRRFIFTRGFWAVYMGFAPPFLIPFAFEHLAISASAIGLFMGVKILSHALANLYWSTLSDLRGNRLLLIISSLFCLAPPVMVMVAVILPGVTIFTFGGFAISWQFIVLTIAFCLLGAGNSGLAVGFSNYLLELGPPRKRAMYLGVFYVFLFPLAWLPFVGALVIGAGGHFHLAFIISLAAVVLLTAFSLRLREVRDRTGVSDAYGITWGQLGPYLYSRIQAKKNR